MIRIRQAIVVEGRYDKNTLAQVIDAPIFTTEGFGVLKNKEKLQFLREVALKRGLIILTDSDGAGFVIRNYLKGALPTDRVRQAYIPDIAGKERRKQHPGKEGKLGVEGMTPEILLRALRNAGADIEGEDAPIPRAAITHTDLYEAGLSGTDGASERRLRWMAQLQLPAHLGKQGFLDALNILMTREEFLTMAEKMMISGRRNECGGAENP